MMYLVILEDGRFAVDAKARKFCREYPDAHQFDEAGDAYHVAKMLNVGAALFAAPDQVIAKAHAVSVKAYDADDLPFDVVPA